MATTKKAGHTQLDSQRTDSPENLPLFFRDPHPLHPTRHAEAGLNLQENFAFAAQTNSLPLNLVEFFEAARSYPIVFTGSGKTLPVALLGIHEKNCFLNPDGEWMENCYIPAYVRRYPFIFMEDQENNRFILCVDEAAPNFVSTGAAKRFFDDAGEMSEFSSQALQFCKLYQQHHQHTVMFCAALKEHDLLVEKVSTLRLPNGKEVSLSGFNMLDAERFAALPDAVFLEWRQKGWLAAAHAVLVSYTNWKYLAEILGRKQ